MELSRVVRVYSGQPGCMCGCRGQYRDSDRSRKIVFNKIMRNPNHKFNAVAKCVYVETETRNLVAYFA
jgi:hypothetical protein